MKKLYVVDEGCYYDRGWDYDMKFVTFYDPQTDSFSYNEWVMGRGKGSVEAEFVEAPEEIKKKYKKLQEKANKLADKFWEKIHAILDNCPVCGKRMLLVRNDRIFRLKTHSLYCRHFKAFWCPDCKVTICYTESSWGWSYIAFAKWKRVDSIGFSAKENCRTAMARIDFYEGELSRLKEFYEKIKQEVFK